MTPTATSILPAENTHHRTFDRLLFHASWVLAAVVFMTVGWTAMRPWDPRGPVSLLAAADPSRMVLQVLALSAVIAAVVTVIAGRRHVDIGAFAVGAGLVIASFRGDNMTYLLIQWNASAGLCLSLLGEALFWTAVMFTALLVSAITVRWTFGASHDPLAQGADIDSPAAMLDRSAGAGLPLIGRLFMPPTACEAEAPKRAIALKHLALAATVAIVLIRVFSVSSATPDRAIRHGQAFFAVAAGFYIATRQAQHYFPVRSNLWACLAVPAVCLIAYAFAWLTAIRVPVDHLAPVPPSSFLRALPITYIPLGISAALLARWRAFEAHAPEAVLQT